MANNIVLSIVMPAYQEEQNLRVLLPRLLKTIDTSSILSEIIVVDTQLPMDKTSDVCEEFGVRHLKRSGDNTFGSAVRTGILEARGEYILFMDADGSHPPEFIVELFRYAAENDVVIASRYIDKGNTENSLALIIMSRIVNWSFAVVLNLPCKDVSNSFKVYRASQLKAIELRCDNFDIVEEILFKLKRNNPSIKFKEIPFLFKKRMYGETKRNLFVFIITYLITIIKLRFRK